MTENIRKAFEKHGLSEEWHERAHKTLDAYITQLAHHEQRDLSPSEREDYILLMIESLIDITSEESKDKSSILKHISRETTEEGSRELILAFSAFNILTRQQPGFTEGILGGFYDVINGSKEAFALAVRKQLRLPANHVYATDPITSDLYGKGPGHSAVIKKDKFRAAYELEVYEQITELERRKVLSDFDMRILRAISTIALSAEDRGNIILSTSLIYREMASGEDKRASASIKHQIRESMRFLASLFITAELKDLLPQGKSFEGPLISYISILDAAEEEDDIFKLAFVPPTALLAEEKGWIHSKPMHQLRTPSLSFTPQNIILKSYLENQLIIRERNPKLNTSINLEKLYQAIKPDANKTEKVRIRDQIEKILCDWKDAGTLNSWRFNKKGRTFTSISISINKKKAEKEEKANVSS